MPPDHFMGFPNSPHSPLSFFFSPQMAPPHPYVKPIWRRLSPRCSTEAPYKKMAILAEPDTRLLREDEWGSRREKRDLPGLHLQGGSSAQSL